MWKYLIALLVIFLSATGFSDESGQFQAIYHLDRVRNNQVRDSGDEQIDGVLSGPYTPAAGKKGLSIFFNGVDNVVRFPAFFSGAQDRLSLWICPASNPTDHIIARFEARFDGNRLDFGRYRAFKDHNGKPDWGVIKRKQAFESRMGQVQYVFAADTPFSGFRMQAWLSPSDGSLHIRYASPDYNGVIKYTGLSSRSKVWVKNLWSHIELRLDQKNHLMSLYINGTKEAQTAFYTAEPRIPYSFSLGASQRNGLPFYGKIDEFKVISELSAENRIFPEGNFEYARNNQQTKIDLAFPFCSLALDPAHDEASLVKIGNETVQKICITGAERGVFTRIYLPLYKESFSVRLGVKSEEPGKLQLLISGSPNPEFASKREMINTGNLFRTCSLDGFIEGKGTKYLIILFEIPGVYWIRNVCIY